METQNTVDSQDLPKLLSDAAWNSMLPFLRDCRTVYVGNPEKCRCFLSAVLWIAKEGATWRALPKVYGNWNASTVDSVDGVMRVFSKHSMNIFTMRARSQVSSLIPRSCGHMPRQRGAQKKGGQEAQVLGRTRGGFTTKLNLSLSDACVPLRFILTPGHRNDITQASALLEGNHCYEYVIGDKAYDSDAFIAEITSRDAIAVIPPRKGRTEPRAYDETLYKRRNLIERFFGWLKQYRRVATRYDKLARLCLHFATKYTGRPVNIKLLAGS